MVDRLFFFQFETLVEGVFQFCRVQETLSSAVDVLLYKQDDTMLEILFLVNTQALFWACSQQFQCNLTKFYS